MILWMNKVFINWFFHDVMPFFLLVHQFTCSVKPSCFFFFYLVWFLSFSYSFLYLLPLVCFVPHHYLIKSQILDKQIHAKVAPNMSLTLVKDTSESKNSSLLIGLPIAAFRSWIFELMKNRHQITRATIMNHASDARFFGSLQKLNQGFILFYNQWTGKVAIKPHRVYIGFIDMKGQQCIVHPSWKHTTHGM